MSSSSFIPRPHEIYKHFKGNLYQITAIAEHTETGEQLVVYQALYGDFKTYARPLSMFVERVDKSRYPDAAQEFRFELQGPEAERQRAETAVAEAGEPKESEAERQRAETAAAETGEPEESEAERQRAEMAATEAGKPGESEAERQKAEMAAAEDGESVALDPLVLEFLDSDSYEQRLNILAGLHHRITDEMLTTMAIACDVEVGDGGTEERYEALKSCLLTLERYECNRLR